MEQEYFQNYCDRGQHYSKCWQEHSGYLDCLMSIEKLNLKKQIHTVLVLGSADSSILDAFEKASFVPDGIELFGPIVPKRDTRVTHGDFLNEVPDLFRSGVIYDLIFANSLVYLKQPQLIPFLGFCAHMAPYFHSSSSVTGHEATDPWRRITMPQEWWNEIFNLAGWNQTSEPYLYESRMYEKF